MNVFLHGFGGSAAVNFRVKGYADEATLLAAAPPANTVGVVGSVSGWKIVDILPESFETGILYILVGADGTAELDLGKILLHPVQAWLDGSVVDAWIYQDGAWTQFAAAWDGYYFKDGDQYTDITGGWAKIGDGGTVSVGEVLSVKAQYYSSGASSACVGTVNKVDLTNVKTLYFDSPSGQSGDAYGAYLRIADDTSSVRTKQFTAAGQHSIDVSDLTGEYYLHLGTTSGGNGSGYGDIRAIWRD